MLTGKQKIRYFIDSLLAFRQKIQCTYCRSEHCKEIDRKYLFTKLMECQNCHLYFRFPTDKKETNADFYQIDYRESDQITTELPDYLTLEQMKINGFRTANKNGDRHLDLFARLFPSESSLKIIDYGCSWGYLTYQFKKAGHQMQGYEISRPRAEYGIKQLDLEIYTDESLLGKENDIFFPLM